MSGILGLHHMTAISGPAQENVDFYAGTLGLRLVKKTVNFDDPFAYHLYYGDGLGTPGTILTFFPYPDGYQSRPGAGQVVATSLSVPVDSLGFWIDRFAAEVVPFEMPVERDGVMAMTFLAPDGLQLELVGDPGYQAPAALAAGPVPVEHAIGGMHSVTLLEKVLDYTDETLVQHLGFTRSPDDDDVRVVYQVGDGRRAHVDVRTELHAPRARAGHGSVHHIAFRVATQEEQEIIRQSLVGVGFNVSAVLDRSYFHSIYFREPGGVLFEIATDPPGFGVDEAMEELGTHLRLPAQHEHLREQLEDSLPPLVVPQWSR
ncbi:MAG: ring-cleaving dioxygenase [Fimbriimonas sp.]